MPLQVTCCSRRQPAADVSSNELSTEHSGEAYSGRFMNQGSNIAKLDKINNRASMPRFLLAAFLDTRLVVAEGVAMPASRLTGSGPVVRAPIVLGWATAELCALELAAVQFAVLVSSTCWLLPSKLPATVIVECAVTVISITGT